MELNLDIEQAVRELQKALDKEFSNPACAYDISFQNKRYNFEPAVTTKEEYEQQRKLRRECIRELLFDHVANIVDQVTWEHGCKFWKKDSSELVGEYNPDCGCIPVRPDNLIIGTLKWSSYNKEEHEVKIASDSYMITPEQIKEELHENVKMQLENDKKIKDILLSEQNSCN